MHTELSCYNLLVDFHLDDQEGDEAVTLRWFLFGISIVRTRGGWTSLIILFGGGFLKCRCEVCSLVCCTSWYSYCLCTECVSVDSITAS